MAFHVKADPLLDARVFFEKGNVFLRTQQYDEAITAFTQAITSNPNFAQAYHKRGTAYYYSQMTDLACQDWQQACRIEHFCLGWNYGIYNRVCKNDLESAPKQ